MGPTKKLLLRPFRYATLFEMNMTNLNVPRFQWLGIACEAIGNDSLMLWTENDGEESEIGDFVQDRSHLF